MNFKKTASVFLIIIFSLFTAFLVTYNLKKLLFTSQDLKVLGFLPYWNMTGDYQVDFKKIDQLIYFSLMVNELGDFDQTDPGFTNFYSEKLDNLIRQAKENNKQVLLCIASFDAEVMYQVTLNPEIRKKLIDNIIWALQEKNFDGVDIDFEYFWQVDHEEVFGDNFNIFLEELKKAMNEINPQLILSVDIYPKAIIENYPYKFTKLNQISDQIIIMAYDYTVSIAPHAGPIAPIETDFRLQIEDNYSIVQTIKALPNKISLKKAFLGIPLYGYEWQTIDKEHRSQVVGGKGETILYGKTEALIKEKNPQINWDSLAQSPWLVYEENRLYYQLYFENPESLKVKYRVTGNSGLEGIAFWALGYEAEINEVWDLFKK